MLAIEFYSIINIIRKYFAHDYFEHAESYGLK